MLGLNSSDPFLSKNTLSLRKLRMFRQSTYVKNIQLESDFSLFLGLAGEVEAAGNGNLNSRIMGEYSILEGEGGKCCVAIHSKSSNHSNVSVFRHLTLF